MTSRNLTNYGIDMRVARAYAENLELHLEAVRTCGAAMGVPDNQLRAHDSSKWSKAEFPAYARQFYGHLIGLEKDPAEFDAALAHHYAHNLHHWQRWIIPGAMSQGLVNKVLEMPDHYVREMVADWQAASIAYTGKEDIGDWLEKNLDRIALHHTSYYNLCSILNRIGYGDIISSRAQAHYQQMSYYCYVTRHEQCPEFPEHCTCDCHRPYLKVK